ncbi:hypothetical protein INT48_009793 [Thamnidium elegans]|uniref:Uncharacterized protein n=1 Tax=Thamnidium elegans TaxID=101142 RepID=A0A8H7VZ76_9FUNG|nr:hypothetical protein INT48_009793 [Thamnidium elegans]
MSTVSMQNESLPSFEPIEQNTTQKRKRTSTTVKEDDTSPVVKKSRAKKSSRNHTTQPVTIRKSIVWIGASLSQDDGSSGAFSVYYGINDTRNYTEKVTIKESQGLDYVYTMGVICVLDTFKNDTTALVIYTGRKILETFEQDTSCDIEIYNELRQKIEKRKGSTFIEDESQEEYKNAHNLSVEKLLEDNMAIDKVAECLQITETKTEVLVLTSRVETTECEKVEVETTVEEVACSSSAAVVVEPASWASTLRLRNLLDVLKAPFSRKNKQK